MLTIEFSKAPKTTAPTAPMAAPIPSHRSILSSRAEAPPADNMSGADIVIGERSHDIFYHIFMTHIYIYMTYVYIYMCVCVILYICDILCD